MVSALSNPEDDKLIDMFNDNFLFNRGIDYDCMNYINNWTLLMPVLDKIESNNGINSAFSQIHKTHLKEVYTFYLELDYLGRGRYTSSNEAATKIQAVYYGIVEFLKWLNNKKN